MTPWDLARPGTEHAHQRALFSWASVVASHGFDFAYDELAYDHRTREGLTAKYWANPYPAASRLFAIHNQGHGDAVRGARAKAEGVKSGVPDVMLPVTQRGPQIMPCAGLFIELKRVGTKGKARGDTSKKQEAWIEYLNDAGYIARVAYGWEDAASFIRDYLTHRLTR